MIPNVTFSVSDASSTTCKELLSELIDLYRIVGKNPFWSKYTKEAYSFNKTGIVSFEDPKIKDFSQTGKRYIENKRKLNSKF